MKLSLHDNPDVWQISGYEDGGFHLGGQFHHGSLLLDPRRGPRSWQVDDSEQLSIADFPEEILADTDLLIIGCGNTPCLPVEALQLAMLEFNIAVEFMDTPAACRTYNILLSEDRRVLAALISL